MAIIQNRIRDVRKQKGWTQQQLADAVGSHWITISKLERGVQVLNFPWMKKLAGALEVEPHELLTQDKPLTTTIIMGTVEQDGIVGSFPEDDVKVDYVFQSMFDSHTDDWVSVEGDVLWPYFHDGDVICLTHTHRQSDEFLNRFVWFLIDGEQYGRVGLLTKGVKQNTFDLQIGSAPPIRQITGQVVGYVSFAAYNLPVDLRGRPQLMNMEERISILRTREEMEENQRARLEKHKADKKI